MTSRILFVALLLGAVGLGGFYALSTWRAGGADDLPLMATAKRTKLRVIVTERGNLESRKTVDGICEVKGYDLKIIFIVPEGDLVEKGDVVVRIDTAAIDEKIARQEIDTNQAESKVKTTAQELKVQKNTGESEIATAKLEFTLAKLDLRKYREGDYEVEKSDLMGQIALAKSELEEANDEFEHFRQLVKRGFRTREQMRVIEQKVQRTEFYLQRDEHKLRVLETFDYERKMTELEFKAEEAERKVARAQDNAKAQDTKFQSQLVSAEGAHKLADNRLKELRSEREKCEIIAAQAGVVAYGNENWWGSDRRIREGATVRQRQRIFSLPDMTSMQAEVNVHESVVKKIKPGQTAEIRVEAFANVVLTGTVQRVSPLADSRNSWSRGGVKEYKTIVLVDDLNGLDLKPGMTAEVKILVNEIDNALVVPVQSVTEHEHEHYIYTYDGEGFDRRKVKIGDSNEKMVEILDGLDRGMTVALDARTRGSEDFGEEVTSDEPEAEEPKPQQPPPAAQPPPVTASAGG